MEELKRLVEGSAGCSTRLKKENAAMAKKVGEMARQFEDAERRLQAARKERELEAQLHEAQVPMQRDR